MPIERAAEPVTANPIRRRGWVKGAVLLLVVSGVAAGVWWSNYTPLPDGIVRADYQAAAGRFRDRYDRIPDRLDVLSLLAEEATRDGRLETAEICFHEIPSDHPRYGASARLQEGQVLIRLNRADAAERSFREYLDLVRSNPLEPAENLSTAFDWLVYILSVELRFEDRRTVLEEMHERGLAGVWDSKLLFCPNLLIWNSPEGKRRLAEFVEQDPENPDLLQAQGRYLTVSGDLAEARALLEDLQRRFPDDLRIAGASLECRFENDDWEGFRKAADSVPQHSPTEPWLLTRMRGEWALEERRWDEAVRCFEAVVANDPSNPMGTMGLARAYESLGESGMHDEMLQRSLVLSEMRVSLPTVTEQDPDAVLRLADDCEKIGFSVAAAIFRGHAERIARQESGDAMAGQ